VQRKPYNRKQGKHPIERSGGLASDEIYRRLDSLTQQLEIIKNSCPANPIGHQPQACEDEQDTPKKRTEDFLEHKAKHDPPF